MGIQLLDCTLRDGGHLNKSKFGENVIKGIISGLEKTRIEMIEIGFLRNFDVSTDYAAADSLDEFEKRFSLDNPDVEYSVMVQEDQYDVDKLPECKGKIKRIRVSFHDFDIPEGLMFCRKVIEKGYLCHVNPINITGYSDAEIIKLVEAVNQLNAGVFTMVDTFGSMTNEDLLRIFMLVHNNLKPEIAIGIHLHDNLRMAFSLAQTIFEIAPMQRDIIIDASLLGMGRAPGNLCIELIMEYLNRRTKTAYNVDEALDLIDEYISVLQKKYPWGYETAYSLSAQYKLHRTYAEYLMKKQKLKTKEIKQILGMIEKNKKAEFDEGYIEALYDVFVAVDVDDTLFREQLKELIGDRKVLLVAPGASLNASKDKVIGFVEDNQPVIISANFKCNYLQEDYVFCSNIKRFEKIADVVSNEKIILASHVKSMISSDCNTVNTNDLAWFGDLFWDNCMLMLIKLIAGTGKKECYVAGWDGFSKDHNFIDEGMETIYSYDDENKKVIQVLKKQLNNIHIDFITASKYQENE